MCSNPFAPGNSPANATDLNPVVAAAFGAVATVLRAAGAAFVVSVRGNAGTFVCSMMLVRPRCGTPRKALELDVVGTGVLMCVGVSGD